jgi:hypothetical protein
MRGRRNSWSSTKRGALGALSAANHPDDAQQGIEPQRLIEAATHHGRASEDVDCVDRHREVGVAGDR